MKSSFSDVGNFKPNLDPKSLKMANESKGSMDNKNYLSNLAYTHKNF